MCEDNPPEKCMNSSITYCTPFHFVASSGKLHTQYDYTLRGPKVKIITRISTQKTTVSPTQGRLMFHKQAARQLLYQAFQTHRYQSCIDHARREIRLGDHLLDV